MKTSEIIQMMEAAADVGDLDTVQACDAQLSYDVPISALALRLKSAVDKSGGRVLSVSVGIMGISIQLDWTALRELADSVGQNPTIQCSGAALHAELQRSDIKWTACQQLTAEQMQKLAELI
jgi:hypothetical protein